MAKYAYFSLNLIQIQIDSFAMIKNKAFGSVGGNLVIYSGATGATHAPRLGKATSVVFGKLNIFNKM